jgi:hypothetical protein
VTARALRQALLVLPDGWVGSPAHAEAVRRLAG